MSDGGKGMSAAQACRRTKRAKAPERDQVTFTIKHRGDLFENITRADVGELCVGVREGLVTSRLNRGERDLDMLRRPPEDAATRKRKMQPIRLFSRKKKA